jgi:ribosomal protein L40E
MWNPTVFDKRKRACDIFFMSAFLNPDTIQSDTKPLAICENCGTNVSVDATECPTCKKQLIRRVYPENRGQPA